MVVLTSVSQPTDGIRHQQANTSADIDGQDLGNGTLYIAESCVTWQRESDGHGFIVQYTTISSHAISRDLSFFPHECLHLVVEGAVTSVEGGPDSGVREGSEGDPIVTDVRFVPLDKEVLKQMFAAMSYCQGLHPDPREASLEDQEEECDEGFEQLEEVPEGDEGGFDYGYEEETAYFDSAEEVSRLSALGRAQLARFDALLQAGQGDGPCPANGHHQQATSSGEGGATNGEPGSQFLDADME